MALVKIPEVLENLASGKRELEVKGNTLSSVINSLEKVFPGIKERLTEQGEIKRFINVYVDGEDVRFTGGLKTRVKPESEITILPAVAGGN